MEAPVKSRGKACQEKVIADLIESIAMGESSIAHILNAEGEKLDAAINMPNVTANELLAINNSIKSTIDAVIRLELTIKAKLELLSCAICKTY